MSIFGSCLLAVVYAQIVCESFSYVKNSVTCQSGTLIF